MGQLAAIAVFSFPRQVPQHRSSIPEGLHGKCRYAIRLFHEPLQGGMYMCMWKYGRPLGSEEKSSVIIRNSNR